MDITWTSRTPNRLQGVIDLGLGNPAQPVYNRVLLIRYEEFVPHWCGYLQYPNHHMPPPYARDKVLKYTSPVTTFMGPSGPHISWMIHGPSGELNLPDMNTQHFYWIGFDLPADMNQSGAERLLDSYIESFIRLFTDYTRRLRQAH